MKFSSEGTDSHEEEGNYLDMSDPPNYDDFMYLRWVELTKDALLYNVYSSYFNLGLKSV